MQAEKTGEHPPAAVALAGRVAVVTGSAGFIGAATARALASDGALVACVDLADPAAVAEGLTKAGHSSLGIQADLRDPHAVDEAVRRALDWQGRIDVLVNMAGLFYDVPRQPFWEIDATTWDKVVESNVRTTFLCAKAVSAPMRDARRGRIVNVSSNTAVFGMADFLHYVTAKAAIVGMTRAMARELGPYGVAVNAVAPGLVRTERGIADLGADYFERVAAGQCLQSSLEIEDVCDAVKFLASDDARMVTGQTLLVNGGASMGPF